MFRLINSFMALLFLFGAAVQFNDPDPLRWAAIYVAAAVACGLAAMKRLRWWFAASVALVALAWATLVPGASPNARIGEWEMADARIEEGREMYGLLIIAIYMAVLTATSRRSVA